MLRDTYILKNRYTFNSYSYLFLMAVGCAGIIFSYFNLTDYWTNLISAIVIFIFIFKFIKVYEIENEYNEFLSKYIELYRTDAILEQINQNIRIDIMHLIF